MAALIVSVAPAQAVVLYDGSLNTTPTAQGWLTYADNDIFSQSPDFYTTSGGQTRLNTTSSDGVQAGFSNYTPGGAIVNGSFPTLNRNVGFTLSFTMQVSSEVHASTDRAGFSVIALGSDAKGIEIGFWGSEVFAQNGGTSPTLHTHGESATFNTTSSLVNYDLLVGAGAYELKANGTSILTGSIRDYSAFVPPLFVPDPYEIANYIFLGDNTTSAQGDATFTQVSVAVPEPVSIGMICVAGILITRRRR